MESHSTKDELISGNNVTIINVHVPFSDGATVLIDGNLKDNIRVSNTIATVNKGQVPIGLANLSSADIQLKSNEKYQMYVQ